VTAASGSAITSNVFTSLYAILMTFIRTAVESKSFRSCKHHISCDVSALLVNVQYIILHFRVSVSVCSIRYLSLLALTLTYPKQSNMLLFIKLMKRHISVKLLMI